MKKRGATYTKGTKPNPKQKYYTITNREAVALIDYIGMFMTVNMMAIGIPSEQIEARRFKAMHHAGAIFLHYGYDTLTELVAGFIAHQTENAKKIGRKFILPEYQFMNKQGEMIDIKELLP
jgi:spore maturation protein SpmB